MGERVRVGKGFTDLHFITTGLMHFLGDRGGEGYFGYVVSLQSFPGAKKSRLYVGLLGYIFQLMGHPVHVGSCTYFKVFVISIVSNRLLFTSAGSC